MSDALAAFCHVTLGVLFPAMASVVLGKIPSGRVSPPLWGQLGWCWLFVKKTCENPSTGRDESCLLPTL